MGKLKFNKRVFVVILVLFLLGLGVETNKILFYPSSINIVSGENRNLEVSFPFFLDISQEEEKVVQASYDENVSHSLKKSYLLAGIQQGEAELQLKILGLIPVKNYNINVISRPELVPGGNAIGVRLNTKGVLVVAVTDVINTRGERSSPAKNAGIKVGDSILEINEIKVLDAEHVVKLLNEFKNKDLKILLQRNKTEFLVEAKAESSIQDNSYRLGVWVRDKTSGIGTLTYYDDKTYDFGALGHGIVDTDTGDLLSVDRGRIMNAKISKVEQGKKGTPGEIRGVFYETNNLLGDIYLNCNFGIYGQLEKDSMSQTENKAIPIAFKEEVKEGKAHILTTVEGDKVEKFEIEINKIQSQLKADQKSMVIKVTDERLLNKTGGIVQGMSGSPIIQNDRLVGAVTHVFVNDPSKGYGIFIEWMLEQKDRP